MHVRIIRFVVMWKKINKIKVAKAFIYDIMLLNN